MKKIISTIFFLLINASPLLWRGAGGEVFSQVPVWYITPGNPNPDMSWGVDVDSSGNAWWATNEVVLPDSLYDIYISKIDTNGQTLWKKKLFSTPYNDIAFIVKIKPPYLFVGGRTETDTSAESANLLLLTCLMQNDTLALQWNHQWDGGFGYEELDGIEADTSGIYIAGWTSPDTVAAHKDMVVQKLDFNGTVVWDTVWEGTLNGFEGANGHLVIDDSAIYIAAHYNQWPGRALLIAFDKNNGNYLWDTKWDNTPLNPFYYDDFYGLAMSTDSFLYAAGPCDGWFTAGQQALVKYNRSGDTLWARKWGGPLYEFGRALVADGDSIIYSTANTYSYGNGKTDIALLKYNASGNLLDSAIWGTQKYELVHDIAIFGNYLYLVGTTDTAGQVVGLGSPEENAFLLKVDKRTFLFPDTIPDVFTSAADLNDSQNIEVEIYPNPTKGKLEIRNWKSGIGTIEIYNVLGEKVYEMDDGRCLPAGQAGMTDNGNTSTINHQPLTINLDSPNGIYFMKMNTGTKQYVQKIIISK